MRSFLKNVNKLSTLLSVATLSVILVFQLYFYIVLQHNSPNGVENYDVVLLWWTPFFPTDRTRICGNVKCFVTSSRKFINHSKLVALLFYGSSFNARDVPRKTSIAWGLLHEESPRNNLLLSQTPVLSLFNYSATFSRASHFPLTFQFLPSLESLTSVKYFKTFSEKNAYQKDLAPIMYLQSDCSTPNNRDSYVSELMKYIAVDSYGKCLNNRKMPENLGSSVDFMMSGNILELTSKYKFSIAIENALCKDYVTEKLWRPLVAGSVPLYVGSPTIKDWLPNNKSTILPMEFDSPQELASLLNHLNTNEIEYNLYLDHKIHQTIDNDELKSAYVKSYFWDRPDDETNVVDLFECFLCTQKSTARKVPSVVNRSHYDCAEQVSILSKTFNSSNWWQHSFREAAVEAETLAAQINLQSDGNT